jgi:hypothetical protein
MIIKVVIDSIIIIIIIIIILFIHIPVSWSDDDLSSGSKLAAA